MRVVLDVHCFLRYVTRNLDLLGEGASAVAGVVRVHELCEVHIDEGIAFDGKAVGSGDSYAERRRQHSPEHASTRALVS